MAFSSCAYAGKTLKAKGATPMASSTPFVHHSPSSSPQIFLINLYTWVCLCLVLSLLLCRTFYWCHDSDWAWSWMTEGSQGSLNPLITAICNQEPQVFIIVSGCLISFLLDTGATYLVLREFWGPTSPSSSPIVGVGDSLIYLNRLHHSIVCLEAFISLIHF